MTSNKAQEMQMNMTAKNNSNTADREIAASRVFDAPCELVFDAWTDAEHVSNWWGPRGFTTTTLSMDLRPGGEWRFVMHGPDGRDYQNRVVYTEINRPQRLAYRHDGVVEGDAIDFEVTVDFVARQDGKTVVSVRMVFESEVDRDRVSRHGAVEGLHDTLARLAEFLDKNRGE